MCPSTRRHVDFINSSHLLAVLHHLRRVCDLAHTQVVYFSKELLKYISDDYDLACEHAHSCTLLIAHKKFRVDGRWHTWIDYDKFHELAATGQPFTSLDYAAPTPEWAVFGNAAAGFDPEEERVFVKGVKVGA